MEQQPQYTKKPAYIAELPRFMMFASGDDGVIENVPKLIPQVINGTKIGFTVFDRSSGTLEVTNYSFLLTVLEGVFASIEKDIGKPEAVEYTLHNVRPTYYNPNRPSEGSLNIGKTDKGMCYLSLAVKGKKTQVFNFKTIKGNNFLKNGKDMDIDSVSYCLLWLEGLISSAKNVSNLLAYKEVKVLDNNIPTTAAPTPDTKPDPKEKSDNATSKTNAPSKDFDDDFGPDFL